MQHIQVPRAACIGTVKKLIARKFSVDPSDLNICDIWRSTVNREYKDNDGIDNISWDNDDIFVYHTTSDDSNNIDSTTHVVSFQYIQQLKQYYHSKNIVQNEVWIGYPLMIKFSKNTKKNINDIEQELWQMVRQFVKNGDRKHISIMASLASKEGTTKAVLDCLDNDAKNKSHLAHDKDIKFIVLFADKTNFVDHVTAV